jgi:hypothetical protein
VYVYSFLTSGKDRFEWSASRFDRFIPGERSPALHSVGEWVGSRASLLSMPGIEQRFLGRPARSFVAIRTTLSRLPEIFVSVLTCIFYPSSLSSCFFAYFPFLIALSLFFLSILEYFTSFLDGLFLYFSVFFFFPFVFMFRSSIPSFSVLLMISPLSYDVGGRCGT